MTLHRIHKVLLNLVENQDAQREYDKHESEAVGQPTPTDEMSCSQRTIFESLNHRSHGINTHDRLKIHTQGFFPATWLKG